MLLSVIVPCYNEEPVLRETHQRLVTVLQSLAPIKYEIIYVDDGSRDQTTQILKEIHAGNQGACMVSLSRNFGHQLAITAGLEHARGDAVVIIDADLQDPPEVIPEMVERWVDGYDVVYGVRIERPGENRFRLGAIRLFYRLINLVSNVKMLVDVGDFRLVDRKVVDALAEMLERDRYLRGMMVWIGFRQTAVFYKRFPRFAGKSNYPLLKLLRLATDAVLSFSLTPLRLSISTGFLAIGIALVGIVYALYERLVARDAPRGWTSLFVAVLFMGGVQLITLGIIGEYIGRIYGEVKRRPLYLVQESLGFDEHHGRSDERQTDKA